MLDKGQTRSKKSFGFNIRTKVVMVVCLKQNLVQQSNIDDRLPIELLRKHQEMTVSTRITSNLSSHKNSVDESAANRFRKQDSVKTTKDIKLASHDTSIYLMGSRPQTPSPNLNLHRNQFVYLSVLGKGGFGKVWRVELKKNSLQYALKEMSKALIITKKSVPSVMNEKNLLSKLKHPFLVNMVASFQDRQTLHLVMDLMPGGDLRHHIARRRRFTQQQAKFIAANIFLCLEYLHQNSVIHRDIKPQNIVFDQHGYLRVTDLGIARYWKQENSSDTSGTPGYMGSYSINTAPEVMCRENHSYAVDFFALGVIIYQLMLGKRPYQGRNRKQIRDQVLARQVQVKKHEVPEGWSLESADFVNRMIQRKPANRLGTKCSQQIRKHPWLRNVPWERLVNKSVVSPYIPNVPLQLSQIQKNMSQQHLQISSQNTQTKQLMMQNTVLLRKQQVQQLFKGYQQPFIDISLT